MKFFEAVRPSAYFQGGRLKKDNKTGIRYWSLTFAITMESAHVYRCEEVITSNFEQISAEENRCSELAINISIPGHEIEFYELEKSDRAVLRLKDCDISNLRMTQNDGLIELWITVEHSNGDALHAFVKDYAFTRLWLSFVPRQGKLADGGVVPNSAGPIVREQASSLPISPALADALDRMAKPVRDGGMSSLTISAAGQTVTIDKEAAERIHRNVQKEMSRRRAGR